MVGLSCRTEHLGLFLLYVRGEPAMKQHQDISKFLNINAFFRSPGSNQSKTAPIDKKTPLRPIAMVLEDQHKLLGYQGWIKIEF